MNNNLLSVAFASILATTISAWGLDAPLDQARTASNTQITQTLARIQGGGPEDKRED